MITINYIIVHEETETPAGYETKHYPVTITGKDLEDCENQAEAFMEDMKMRFIAKLTIRHKETPSDPRWYYYIKTK